MTTGLHADAEFARRPGRKAPCECDVVHPGEERPFPQVCEQSFKRTAFSRRHDVDGSVGQVAYITTQLQSAGALKHVETVADALDATADDRVEPRCGTLRPVPGSHCAARLCGVAGY